MFNLDSKEKCRLLKLTQHEKKARSQGYKLIAGVDEAGRGPLAGPVVAAACVFPPKLFLAGINDSKQLSPAQREYLFEQITQHKGIDYGIGTASCEEIDLLNILQASILAMHRALEKLQSKVDFLLVDGNYFNHPSIPFSTIVEGDSRSQSIAAASILAKETRDRIMKEQDLLFPHYGFAKHKGYPTPAHLEAISKHGPCSIHRKSFSPLRACFQIQVASGLRQSLGDDKSEPGQY